MEGLVPTDVKPLYTGWVFICDEIKAAVADTKTSPSTGRGQSVLKAKSRTLERISVWYDKVWEDFMSQLLTKMLQ